jgi:hypothetical protein
LSAAILAAVPASIRSTCRSFDLEDADPEVLCEAQGVDLYLAKWPSKKLVQAALSDALDVECDPLDVATGTIVRQGDRVGRGGGCADAPSFSFSNEDARLFGSVEVLDGTFDDALAWFESNRPGLAKGGRLSGTALDGPVGELNVKQLRGRATPVPYRSLLRNPERYEGTLLYFEGRVLQVIDEGALVAIADSAQDVVFVSYTSLERLLDGDHVEFAGLAARLFSYVTVAGIDKEVPAIEAIDLDMATS